MSSGPRPAEVAPIKGTVIRVYDPPLALDSSKEQAWRDFDATKIELNADGSIVLSKIELLEEKPDLRPNAPHGQNVQSWKSTILAVIDRDGHIRAETIVLDQAPQEPAPRVN